MEECAVMPFLLTALNTGAYQGFDFDGYVAEYEKTKCSIQDLDLLAGIDAYKRAVVVRWTLEDAYENSDENVAILIAMQKYNIIQKG